MSAGRSTSRRRRATPIKSWSPAACPAMSLTDLNRSMSTKRTAEWMERLVADSTDWARRSRNSTRLGSPVSASWRAWWVSRPCSSSSWSWSRPRYSSQRRATSTSETSAPRVRGALGHLQGGGVGAEALGLLAQHHAERVAPVEEDLHHVGKGRAPVGDVPPRGGRRPTEVLADLTGDQVVAHLLGPVLAEAVDVLAQFRVILGVGPPPELPALHDGARHFVGAGLHRQPERARGAGRRIGRSGPRGIGVALANHRVDRLKKNGRDAAVGASNAVVGSLCRHASRAARTSLYQMAPGGTRQSATAVAVPAPSAHRLDLVSNPVILLGRRTALTANRRKVRLPAESWTTRNEPPSP